MLPSKDLSEGHEVGGRFSVVRKVSAGRVGATYEAEDASEGGRRVLLELLDLSTGARADDLLVRRFQRICAAVGSLRHPGLARLVAHGRDTGTGAFYYATDLLAGTSLEARLAAHGTLDLEEVCRLAVEVCEALQPAHELGVVHGNLTPEKLFITEGGVKVLDLGMARLERARLSEAWSPHRFSVDDDATFLLSPEFASPEDVQGLRLSPSTDVYLLAVIVYRALAGVPPYDASPGLSLLDHATRHVLAPAVPLAGRGLARAFPGALDRALMTALAKDPASRFSSMAAFAEELRPLLR